MVRVTIGPMANPEPLGEIRAAKAEITKAENHIAALRVDLGRAINRARDAGQPQRAIAEELGLTREQVRRLQVMARNADAHGEEPQQR